MWQQPPRRGCYSDGAGLYLQVTASGAKTWIYRFQIGGKRRDMGLGSAALVTLAQARERATEARRLVAEKGVDPIEARRAQATASGGEMTFADAARQCIEARRAGWRNAKHAAQWEATLATYALPVMGSLPIAEVTTDHVLADLTPI